MMQRNGQGRVARELARRPDVLVGFHPLTESHGKKMLQQTTDVTATWQPGSHLSDPVQFTIVCHNAGDLTARNVLYNFSFPAEMDHMINTQVLQGKMFRSPDDGRPIWSIGGDGHIHPKDSALFRPIVNIPQRLQAFTVETEVSMNDRPAVRGALTVRVNV